MNDRRDPTDILLVSAHLPELVGLRWILGDGLQANVGGLSVTASAVGIGIPAAAAGTAVELCRRTPRAVIFVGTCGAYRSSGLAIGQVVVGRRIHLASVAAVKRNAAFPAPMPVLLETSPELGTALARGVLSEVSVATTLTVTTDDSDAAALSEALDAQVEHLESFAVVAACAREQTACAVILGIANLVGSEAREQWRANHEAAGRAAGEVVVDWIRGGAAGLVPRAAVKT